MDQIANPSPGFQRNPDKVITIEPYSGTVTVRAGDAIVASSTRAKLLTEPPYPGILYIPFEDIDFDQLRKTDIVDSLPIQGRCELLERAASRGNRQGCDVGL